MENGCVISRKMLFSRYSCTRSSRFSAPRMQKLQLETKLMIPRALKCLKTIYYIDDGLAGSNNLATAMEPQQQLMRILTKREINCRKWSENHPQLHHNILLDNREVNLDLNNTGKESKNTLI